MSYGRRAQEVPAQIRCCKKEHLAPKRYAKTTKLAFRRRQNHKLQLIVAALLGIAAVDWDRSGGISGASRHALTVGFISVMILCVGQRVLAAFAGMRVLWSPRLMLLALLLLTFGCAARVPCEVLAYPGYAQWAWRVLPCSAVFELTALTTFGVNMVGTFILQPVHSVREPMVARIAGAGL
jgi:hypothetical protein